MIYLILFLAVIIFLVYLVIDLLTTNANDFQNRWALHTLWIWLPFYALWRLTKEVILKKK